MTHTCFSRLLLLAAATLALLTLPACEDSAPSADFDLPVVATALPTIVAGPPAESAPSPLPTQTPTPEPDLQATVQAMVLAALPSETPTGTPDVPATIEAGVAATVEAIPNSTSTVTSAPIPTATAPIPTATPKPTATRTAVPTPAPTPTLPRMVDLIIRPASLTSKRPTEAAPGSSSSKTALWLRTLMSWPTSLP